MRSGNVAIIGRTNVGKSTFLNAALEVPLAITSPLPQTTRDELLGVVRRGDAEIAFVDTPGLHRPKTELGRRMNASALGTLKSSDLIVFMTDIVALSRRPKRSFLPESDLIDPDDRKLLQALPEGVPVVLVINKVDLVRDKARILPLMAAFGEAHAFRSIVPVSLRRGDGLERILTEIAEALPEKESQFEPDTLTDRPLSFFAREYIREQVMLRTAREVPHAVAVSIERFEQKPKLTLISATIHVEKSGQGSILVGKGGQSIKAIGMGARERLEELIGTRVHLELFVRVSERWKDAPRQLSELGYDRAEGRDLKSLLGRAERPHFPAKKREETKQDKGDARRKKPRTLGFAGNSGTTRTNDGKSDGKGTGKSSGKGTGKSSDKGTGKSNDAKRGKPPRAGAERRTAGPNKAVPRPTAKKKKSTRRRLPGGGR